MFIDFAYADPGAAAAQGGMAQTLMQFAPLVVILIFFWFLIMRPQQQKYKAQQEMLAKLKKGDRIITSGGIVGRITKAGEQFLSVEIAPNVVIEIDRTAVAGLIDSGGNKIEPGAPAATEKK